MATPKKHKLRFDLPEEAPSAKNAVPAPSGWVYRSEGKSSAAKVLGEEGLIDVGARAVAYQAAAMTHAFLFGARLIRLPMDVARRMVT